MGKGISAKKKNNNSKKKIVIAMFSLLTGIFLFVFLLKMEAVSLEAYQTKQVVVAKKDVAAGESFDKSQIYEYFKNVKVNEDCAVDAFSSVEELEKWIEDKDCIMISQNIKKKEIVYKEKFTCIDEMINNYENPVEVGVKVNSYEYCVGGTLRTGDIVDLSVVNLDNGSEIMLENVLILKVFDANGTAIMPEDNHSVSVGFNLMMEKQDFEMYNSALENGTIRITKKIG